MERLVRKTGDGLIDGTWTDAYAYYVGGSYAVSDEQRFELYAIGAPQRHGQNLYKQNIATYSQELAGDIDGYDETALLKMRSLKLKLVGSSIRIGHLLIPNTKVNILVYVWKVDYGGGYKMKIDMLNERENFFHKPLVNLNHFYDVNDQVRLSSILYWSGGSGGGTGTYGSVKENLQLL